MRDCSICLSEIYNPVYPKYCECKTSFHKKCLEKCYEINKICPICRKKNMNNQQIDYHYNNHNLFVFMENLILGLMNCLVNHRFEGLFLSLVFFGIIFIWCFIGLPLSIIMMIYSCIIGIIQGINRVIHVREYNAI